MLDTQPDSRSVRPDYSGPTCNYASRVDVGVRGVAACEARECVAGSAVGLLDVAADAALSRRVARIDVADGNASTRGLVRNLRLKVPESPRVQDASLRPGSPYPRADAVEILEGDSTRGAFGRSDDLLTDTMIHVCREAALLDSPRTKQSLRTLGTLSLKFCPQFHGTTTERVQTCTAEVAAITRRGNVDNPNVYSEPTEHLPLLGIRDVNGDEEVELGASKYKVSLSALETKQRSLVVATNERNHLTTPQRPEVHRIALPRQDAGVVRNRPKTAETTPDLLVGLIAVSYLGRRAHDHLRGQVVEGRTSGSVGKLVQGELPEHLGIPRPARQPIARLIRPQRGHLLGRRPQLHLYNELHRAYVTRSSLDATTTRTGLPSRPQGRGFHPEDR